MASIAVTGAAGFLGRQLIRQLLSQSSMKIQGRTVTIDRITAIDLSVPAGCFDEDRVDVIEGDLADVIPADPELWRSVSAVFHLASAVSGECERDLNLGLQANLQTGISLGKALAATGSKPILVFASSLAVYGGTPDAPLPTCITDSVRPTPQNSYGAQKLMLETLYADLARRDAISVRTVRLMTVAVRPGRPNQAASGFLSGMIREPLAGEPSNIPVPLTLPVVLNRPSEAIHGLLQSVGFSDPEWGSPLGMNLPGLTLTVGAMREALEAYAGPAAVQKLTETPNPAICDIVAGWPAEFSSERAKRLGFHSTETFSAFIDEFLQTR